MGGTMLGKGLYDAAEVGWLLGHDAGWVVRWSTPSAAGPAIVPPSFDRRFSFVDLVSFRVASLIRQRGVSDRDLRRGIEILRERAGVERPLALKSVVDSLATSGKSFLSDFDLRDFEDIGKGRQQVFQEVIGIDLSRIAFSLDGTPERWEPMDGVTIDPAVQAGAPCIKGTRVPTAAVAGALAHDPVEDVALDFNVGVDAIHAAERFEQSLTDGLGLAA